MNDATQARRAHDKAEYALGDALLRADVRNDASDAWTRLYYSRTVKNVANFRNMLPRTAALIASELDTLVATTEAKKLAVAAEKAAKAAARAEREMDRAERAVNPARPLARRNPLAAANFDALSTIFAGQRAEYAEALLAWEIRNSGGKVVANVNEDAVRDAARANFDGYLAKLATKIEARISSGTLQGSLWNGSVLRVETEQGSQSWSTKVIINRSVYNRLFNQWPTRRIA